MNTVALASIPPGSSCCMAELRQNAALRRRLLDLGFLPGTVLQVIHQAPSGTPMAILCRNSVIALRRTDCENIQVIPCNG